MPFDTHTWERFFTSAVRFSNICGTQGLVEKCPTVQYSPGCGFWLFFENLNTFAIPPPSEWLICQAAFHVNLTPEMMVWGHVGVCWHRSSWTPGSGEASPTIWSCYANFKSSISLEIYCFHGLWTWKYLHSMAKLSSWLHHWRQSISHLNEFSFSHTLLCYFTLSNARPFCSSIKGRTTAINGLKAIWLLAWHFNNILVTTWRNRG
jgi:hypothetical protein